jgi:ribosomal protein S18 acetylase RimI-like enzyme
MLEELAIRRFRPHDQVAARELILAGLAERWGYLDASKNPDLDDIAASYAQATFLVAYLETQLIGTGAVVREAEGVCRIVRMSVAGHLRRRGIGKRILQDLRLCAEADGYRQVVLETTVTWHDAIGFYERCGFRRLGQRDGEEHFVLDLRSDGAESRERVLPGDAADPAP